MRIETSVVWLMASAVVLGSACDRRRSLAEGDAAAKMASTLADSGSDATNAPTAGLGSEAAAPRCLAAVLQPGRCVPPPGALAGKSFGQWFAGQDVHDPKDLRTLDGLSVDGCEEVVLASPNERALACVTTEPVGVDPSLAMDGPTALNSSLRVLTVRDRRLVEILTVPIGVTSSEWGQLLFRARYALDGATRSLDVTVDPEDCAAANTRLATYWSEKIAEARRPGAQADLVHAMELERRHDASRVAAVCRAAKHYPLPPPKPTN
jgi:hypothetical protein